jgi:hypothetical protein
MKLNASVFTLKSFVLALVALGLVPAIVAAQTADAPALHDGVVVDAASGTGYLMKSAQGGIQAVDLQSGNVRWESTAAAKPLLLAGDTLVAQAPAVTGGELVVVTLDALRGTQKDQLTIPLPTGVHAQVVDGPSQSFRVEAFRAADGGVVVNWTYEDAGALQGVAPPELDAAAGGPAKSLVAAGTVEPLHGAARLDLATRRAVPLSAQKSAALRPREPQVKTLAKAGGPPAFVSADGRHVLHSERLAHGNAQARYRWTVTDANGAAIGSFDAPISMAPFVVAGTELFYVAMPSIRKEGAAFLQEPLRLRALDARTGAELWHASVVDSEYRGPFPP